MGLWIQFIYFLAFRGGRIPITFFDPHTCTHFQLFIAIHTHTHI